MSHPVRIAMWSGPRNLSTTLMRSFGARQGWACVDEPFYAAWLVAAGETHPMQGDILASQPTAAQEVASEMMAQLPEGIGHQYQKHMTHHMLEDFPLDWVTGCRHAFLIRHPARVIASYARKMESVGLEAIGFPQQARLFEQIRLRTGVSPPVVDSDRILEDPEGVLSRLCAALGISWDPAMLHWPSGARPEDGAWAPHWYDAVWASTGFGSPPGPLPRLESEHARILAGALEIYDRLARHHV